MRFPFSTFAATLLVVGLSPQGVTAGGAEALPTYMASIEPIPGTDSGVTGKVAVFTMEDGTIAYGGFVSGLQSSLQAETCTATNGCGVHIHAGTSCADAAGQGGHYFTDPISSDPWVDARYSSDANGLTTFVDILSIGTDDVEGRAFLVHAEDGSRIGCGLLQRIDEHDLLVAETAPLGASSVTGEVTILPFGADSPVSPSAKAEANGSRLCLFGSAKNLEPNLSSTLDGGSDCTATNGCGAHIHAGTSCADSSTQMGHYYNNQVLSADPWAITSYTSTDASGNGLYAECIDTGFTEYEGRVFIVHANDGSRVSCGPLEEGHSDEEGGHSEEGDSKDAGVAPRAALVTVAVAVLGFLFA